MELNFKELEDRKYFYNSTPWRHKREAIKRRDNYECQWCKAKGKLTVDRGELNRNGRKKIALIVHHIEELEDQPDRRLDDDNLITICFECHERHHKRWEENGKPKEQKWKDERW
jgi:5-methylcytosine-specific restriction endonuclease McrA